MRQHDRHTNGVKLRADGAGDGWANAHRKGLGNRFLMTDVDGAFGWMAFAQNTGEMLFMEYEPDAYTNRGKSVRRFAVVAVFDRKRSRAAADPTEVGAAFHLWLCRMLACGQDQPPRFFFVVGGQTPPWTMIEVDIRTGALTGVTIEIPNAVKDGDWLPIWRTLGLIDLRHKLAHGLRWSRVAS